MRAFRLMLTCIALTVCFAGHCQMRQLMREDGLSSNSVKSLLRDSAGYVWVGTSVGVDLFDGSSLRRIDFPIEEKGELCWVSGMAELAGGDLIVGNNAGLFLLDHLKLTLTRVFEHELHWETTCVERGADGRIFVGSIDGLFVVSGAGKGLTIANVPFDGGGNQSVRDVACAADGVVWVALSDRIVRLSPRKGGASATTVRCTRGRVNKIATAAGGRLFVGTDRSGVLQLRGDSLVPFLLDGEHIADLSADARGTLMVATGSKGAFEVVFPKKNGSQKGGGADLQSPQPAVRAIEGARYDNPFCIYRDAQGLTWIGYLFYGVDYTPFSNGTFRVLTATDRQTNIRSFLIDGRRTLIGTSRGLMVADDGGRPVPLSGEVGSVPVIQIHKHGGLYVVGTIGHGAFLVDARTLAPVSAPEFGEIKSANVYLIRERGDGMIALATTEGLVAYDAERRHCRRYTSRNSQLPGDEVFTVEFDHLGRGWISTRGGMCRLDADGNIDARNIPAPLKQLDMLRSAYRNPSRRGEEIFFLPQHGFPVGYDFASGKSRTFKAEVGETAPSIQFFTPLNDTTCCFATESGLFVGNERATRRFGYIDGLQSLTVGSHSFALDRSGSAQPRLIIATTNELVEASVGDLLRQPSCSVSITLTQIFCHRLYSTEERRQAALTRTIRLNRRSNDLSLTFAPLLYADTRGMDFRYRLDDGPWLPTDGDRQIALRNLFPGTYRLEIVAVGMTNVGATYQLSVPLKWTTLLLSLLALLVVALAAHIVWCKVKKRPYFWERFLPQPAKYRHSKFDRDEGQLLAERLSKLMEAEQLYLKPDLTLSQLAARLGVAPHHLSQLFTQHLGLTYYDYIADLRVEEFKRRAQSPEYERYTIVALSELCGFRSRTTFATAFKKNTGKTPKEWVKMVRG